MKSAIGNASSYLDTTLTPGDQASYTIKANDAQGSSGSPVAQRAQTGAAGTDQVWLVTLTDGPAGSTANTDTGDLTALTTPVVATTAQDAIAEAVSGSITANDAATVPGSSPQTYNFSVGNDGNTGVQASAFVVRNDVSPDGQKYNDGTEGGLTQNADGSYSGYIGLEDLFGFPSRSDNDYNDKLWTVGVQSLKINSLSVTNDADASETTTVTGSLGSLYLSQGGDETTLVDLQIAATPNATATYHQADYAVLGGSSNVIASGTFDSSGTAQFSLPGAGSSDANYTLETGFNAGLGGVPAILNNIVNLDSKAIQIVIDPNSAVGAYNAKTNTLTITRPAAGANPLTVTLPIQIQSNGKAVSGDTLLSNITSQPGGNVIAPETNPNPHTKGTLDGNFDDPITVTAQTTSGQYVITYTDNNNVTQTLNVIVK